MMMMMMKVVKKDDVVEEYREKRSILEEREPWDAGERLGTTKVLPKGGLGRFLKRGIDRGGVKADPKMQQRERGVNASNVSEKRCGIAWRDRHA